MAKNDPDRPHYFQRRRQVPAGGLPAIERHVVALVEKGREGNTPSNAGYWRPAIHDRDIRCGVDFARYGHGQQRVAPGADTS